jgi:hypothetical protein
MVNELDFFPEAFFKGGVKSAKNILPWWVSSATDYVDTLIAGRRNLKVFEWGSGASSIWFSNLKADLISIEDHAEWCEKIKLILGDNISLKYSPSCENHGQLSEEICKYVDGVSSNFFSLGPEGDNKHGFQTIGFEKYAAEILQYPNKCFDIILIDGKARVLCTLMAMNKISDNGLIIFDNSDRNQYNQAYIALYDNGFRRIDFRGYCPGNDYESSTSIFIKNIEALKFGPKVPEKNICVFR